MQEQTVTATETATELARRELRMLRFFDLTDGVALGALASSAFQSRGRREALRALFERLDLVDAYVDRTEAIEIGRKTL